MTLEQLSQIGELVGGVMVVASLIFVGFQMRQNAKATRAESRRASVDAWGKIAFGVASDRDLAQAMLDDRPEELNAGGSLTTDQMRLINFYAAMMGIAEAQYLLYLDGSLPEETWKSFENALITNLALSEQAHRYWKRNRAMHSARFQSLMNDLVPRALERRRELAPSAGADSAEAGTPEA